MLSQLAKKLGLPTKRSRKGAAFGLVEVIVALAIAVVLMTGSVQASLKATQQIKKNETQDEASGIMLRSLELSRSAVKYNLGQIQGGVTVRYYRLEYNSQGTLVLQVASNQSRITSCPPPPARASEFVVSNTGGVHVCNQIEITRLNDRGSQVGDYQIRSIVIYQYLNEVFTQDLISYRTE